MKHQDQFVSTRSRYWVVVFAVTLAVITYIDRVCISQAAPLIMKDLGLTPIQMGSAFAVFAWSYAIFEIPSGWLGDRIGARKVLTRIVIWWSFFTFLTGRVWNHASLLIARFFFGAGEAGAFPNLTKTFSVWLPSSERVQAQGLMWLSARWGGAFTPFVVVILLEHLSWRQVFEVFGVVGIAWAILFYSWYRDDPREHKGVNELELSMLPPAGVRIAEKSNRTPWKKFLTSRSLWLLWAQYFCFNYATSFYITWLPTYLHQSRGLPWRKSSLLAGLPLFLAGLGSLLCGFLTPYVAQLLGSVSKARRLMACIGFSSASALMVLSIHSTDPVLAIVLMGFASFASDLIVPSSWGACMDMGGKFVGTLSATMNTVGAIAGGTAPILNGYILQVSGQNWDYTFYCSAALLFSGSFFWIVLDSQTSLVEA